MRSYQKVKKSKTVKKASIKYELNFKSKDIDTATFKFKDEDDEQVKETILIYVNGIDESFFHVANEFKHLVDTYEITIQDRQLRMRWQLILLASSERRLKYSSRDARQRVVAEGSDMSSNKELYNYALNLISDILKEFSCKFQLYYLKGHPKTDDLFAKK